MYLYELCLVFCVYLCTSYLCVCVFMYACELVYICMYDKSYFLSLGFFYTEVIGNPTTSSSEGKVVPCDTLLLSGSCVVNEAMLTGESVPKVKEAMISALDMSATATSTSTGTVPSSSSSRSEGEGEVVDANNTTLWSRHTLLGGTLLQQHTYSPITSASTPLSNIPPPPDGGCLGLVVRTGFATTQGELMRKILFASDGIQGTTRETFVFIGMLILFAIVAAGMVLADGIIDIERNKFRLVLHCIMIVTSVVPPELPMELSLAITNSLAALVRNMVYCTEPYRISLAGKLDVICFDKTGTLTKDEMILKGVSAGVEVEIIPPPSVPSDSSPVELDGDLLEPTGASVLVKCIMASCHDLMYRRGAPITEDMTENILGDPLEIAGFIASGFNFTLVGRSGGVEIRHPELNYSLKVRQRYPFNSELKRMSVIGTVQDIATTSIGTSTSREQSYIFCKGAPEIIHEHLHVVPATYNDIARKYMQSGKRVLALAYKPIKHAEQVSRLPRSVVERDLLFAGFLVFDCDLKADSKGVMKELTNSNHRVVMITGDSIYTACNVAKRLAMTDNTKGTLVLVPVDSDGGCKEEGNGGRKLVWRKLDMDVTASARESSDVDYSISTVDALAAEYTLCFTGPALDSLQTLSSTSSHTYHQLLKLLAPKVAIFARVSPQQKERVILAMNEAGRFTLMCGDGTNDVGALKAAHVGVSIINNPKLERKVEQASAEGGKKKKSSSKDRVARAMLELKEHEADPTLVKLGDASIASPFTAKRTSIDCVLTVIRQGRCTLVTTIQVYKVLALNCLATAYMMSSLYMRGLKQGDTQMTCSGLVVAILFFFLSQAKPLLTISDSRPPSTVFNRAVIFSILGQFVTHLVCMKATMMLCEAFVHPDDRTHAIPDSKFTPNLVNTCMFILSNQMQANNFWVNYRGAPFMEDLRSNVYFWYLLQGVYVALLIVVGGQFEPLNDLLQLVSLPNRDFQIYFLGILVGNAVLTYGIEKLCRKLE